MGRYQGSAAAGRVRGAVLSIVLSALLGYGLIAGLNVSLPQVTSRALDVFRVSPPPPPPPENPPAQPRPKPDPRPEGAASPPNIHSRRTEVTAPEPEIRLDTESLVTVAPEPGAGKDATAGNADVRGPGTGSGGQGEGTGSGGSGSGAGAGGGTPPRQIGGRLRTADLPQPVIDAGIGGTVEVLFTIHRDGSVSDCGIRRSSGSRALDVTTCRLIEQRYRFTPARDAAGRPIESKMIKRERWIIE
ncbi:energy transducer TonB [Stakelama saccharophila]|uniref:TonB family protein n=1 Tax=Stakelama saccharophila TaxID=3075605 RepID=A0ABZ0BC91_9SPHN|nr:TonB family protein [Stakelama sp. W311]WNO54904.1 TonB family protein [Stakelama sp. W311]